MKPEPFPLDHPYFEWVPITEIHPGDVVKLNADTEPIRITVVRMTYRDGEPSVSLYREPTQEEYVVHLERHDQDLRATWICSSVGWFPVLKAVVPQSLHLAY
jgi:hypothetical protein